MRESAIQIFEKNRAFFTDPLSKQSDFVAFYTNHQAVDRLRTYSEMLTSFLYENSLVVRAEPKTIRRLIHFYRTNKFNKLLNDENFCNYLNDHQNNSVMIAYQLKGTPFDQTVYVQIVLDKPELVGVFLMLNQLGINQDNHVNMVLENPEQFETTLKLLEAQDLNQPVYVKMALDKPALIEQIKCHSEKLLMLNRLGLNQVNYVKMVLENPEQFETTLKLLEAQGLNQPVYVKMALDNPALIEQFKLHSKKFLTLNKLGLNQESYVQMVLDNPEQFERCNQQLNTVYKQIHATLSCIELRLHESSNRKSNLRDAKSEYIKNVLGDSFEYCMLNNCSQEKFEQKLSGHEKIFLGNSTLGADKSLLGRVCRVIMRILTNAIPTILLGAGMIAGYAKHKDNPNMSISDKLFPFFSRPTSKVEVMESTQTIKNTMTA